VLHNGIRDNGGRGRSIGFGSFDHHIVHGRTLNGAQQFVPVGPDGVAEVPTAPLAAGEHALSYAGQDSTGASHFPPVTTYFFAAL